MKKLNFSQRLGIEPVKDSFQIDSMDNKLKMSLWNILYAHVLNSCGFNSFIGPNRSGEPAYMFGLLVSIWNNVLIRPIDEIAGDYSLSYNKLKDWYSKAEWNMIYDLFECVIPHKGCFCLQLVHIINETLEDEMSGYRIVDDIFVQITSEQEIEEIEEALINSKKGKLYGANEHIKSALSSFSDRENPNYRNSIKESISAVEFIARIFVDKPSATLGDALKHIENKAEFHPGLIKGFSSIYGYTCDSGGRHAIKADGFEPKSEDAKLLLVSCSAFVNYLIIKADKAGISLS